MKSLLLVAMLAMLNEGTTADRIPASDGPAVRWYRHVGRSAGVTVKVHGGSDLLVRIFERGKKLPTFDVASKGDDVTLQSTTGTFALSLESRRGGSDYEIVVTPMSPYNETIDANARQEAARTAGPSEKCAGGEEFYREIADTIGGRWPFDERCFTFVVPEGFRGSLRIERDHSRLDAKICTLAGRELPRHCFRNADALFTDVPFDAGRHFIRVTNHDVEPTRFRLRLSLQERRPEPARTTARWIASGELTSVDAGGLRGPRWQWLTFRVDKDSVMHLQLSALGGDARIALFKGAIRLAEEQVGEKRERMKRNLAPGVYHLQVTPPTGKSIRASIELRLDPRQATHTERDDGN